MKYIALKGFNDPAGYQKRGREWTGTPERARELVRAKLIAEDTGEVKEAPAPDNKMRQAPENKQDASAEPGVSATVAGQGEVKASQEPTPGSLLVDQNAADVLAALPQVTDKAVLEQALAAEQAKGEKARKTVTDALQAAVSKAGQG
ncbi:hypothetical protein [Pseudoxanthomonas winnipegensis]|uniref:Uncharacterized protein n=1 Tax=Pseudoxanthomonas winnipegensis TaxID=2480810 RepID=A0A4Q8L9T1_9GAMM|nr:hypothetical protein [Pseudoxanthomonas winnipegensis]RZZ81403.1 hypothetical protein EA663_20480 [Pseudoxanthomonas winnipegensis]TAA25398.1 hypothetical protein EA660_08020 [Pseudoxanthomonas winnipegensis]